MEAYRWVILKVENKWNAPADKHIGMNFKRCFSQNRTHTTVNYHFFHYARCFWTRISFVVAKVCCDSVTISSWQISHSRAHYWDFVLCAGFTLMTCSHPKESSDNTKQDYFMGDSMFLNGAKEKISIFHIFFDID